MKTRIPVLTAVLLLVAAPAFAQATFPGLKALLTDAEWKRAGLDRLTPDQLGVIDAALIKREAGLTAQHQAALATASQTAATAEKAADAPASFGLTAKDGPDWQNIPPLKAKVVKWETPSRFRLDNGQVWESADMIVYDLIGVDIEIQARPNGRFALAVNGQNTTLRVSRVR